MNGMFRQSMTWLHTWSGLVFCWVLYLVFVTGTLGYFDNEIDHWMQPEYTLEPSVPITQSVTAGQSYLQQAGADADSWFITPARDRDALYLNVFWRTPDPENEGQTLFEQENLSNVNGAPLAEPRDTTGGQTLYRMHYNLHYLPSRIGFYFVAVATMIMFVGLITGVIAHKKIFADFFTFRWAKGQRSWLDMHNLLAVATLPFQFMITYSGLLFTVALWMPFVALGSFGFDFEKLGGIEEQVFGQAPPERAGVAAPLKDIAPMVTQAMQSWGADEVRSVSVQFPGDANAQVTVQRTAGIGILSDSMTFSGVSGEKLYERDAYPVAGLSVASATIGLHEGLFAGPLLRWLYFLSGLLGAAMVATGAIYWVIKRKPKKQGAVGYGYRFVERVNVATIVGLIIGIAAFFWANRLLPLDVIDRADWELHVMFIVWGLCFVHACLRPLKAAWVEQAWGAAVLLGLIPLLNFLTTDVHLGASIASGDWYRAGFDLTAAACGAVAALAAVLLQQRWQLSAAKVLPTESMVLTDEQPASAG